MDLTRRTAGALLLGLAAASKASAQTAPPAAPPPREWIDRDTGHRVRRVSDEPGSGSLYFHQNGYLPQGDKLVISVPGGISAVDLATWRITPLVRDADARLLFTGRRSRNVYFTKAAEPSSGASARGSSTVHAVDVDTGRVREIARVPAGSIGSINADETLLLGQWQEREAPLQPGEAGRDARFGQAAYAATGPDGRPLTFAEAKEVRLLQRLEAKIPMEIFTIDTRTGRRRTVHRATDWLNHIQFSATDPQQIMFCHEGPWHRVDRIWSMRLGSEPKLMHQRTMNMEIAGHEFFDVDGTTLWYDLQTPRGEVFWLANVTSGGKRTWYKVERDHWSVHFQVSPDGKFFAGDGGDEEMVAHAKDGKWLYQFTPKAIPDVAGISAPNSEHLVHPGTLAAERLVDMRQHDYRLEPNLHFTPDGKHIIFRSNMHGDVHTYMVELD